RGPWQSPGGRRTARPRGPARGRRFAVTSPSEQLPGSPAALPASLRLDRSKLLTWDNLRQIVVIRRSGSTATLGRFICRLARFTVELQARRGLLILLPRGAGGTPLAGSGRNGRMRGFAGQSKQLSPHPPLRGTFSRGEKVSAPRPFLIAVCNARANRARGARTHILSGTRPVRP